MNNVPHPSTPEFNATVMASAGTGKTWLLVTRLVRLLLDGAVPEGILAITFTRKAAAEMQKRLAERLFQFASLPDQALDERLREIQVVPNERNRDQARRLYERLLRSKHSVRTTTFHAFCQEILRRFPLEADVPPGFELAERTGEIERAAWDALISEATADPDGEIGLTLQTLLSYCRSGEGVRSALSGFINHRSDWWAYTEHSDDPVGDATDHLRQHLAIDPDADPISEFFDTARMAQLQQFSHLLGKHPTKTNLDDIGRLQQALSEDLSAEERLGACKAVFLTQKGEPRSRKASQAQEKKMGQNGQEEFLALHEALSKALLSTLGAVTARTSWHANAAWYHCGSRLLEHFQRIKQEQRLLDFADLEWKAYRLLSDIDNAQWVQYKLDQRIDHLLVDEFQDTNPTQWRLLLPLLQEMAAGKVDSRRRSVFLVGDAKQSIYRFRRADHRLFSAAAEWLGQHMDAHAHTLDTSWRSAPVIMQCVNRIFGDVSMRALMPDFPRHDTHHHELWGQVTLLPLVDRGNPPEAVQGLMRNPLQSPRELNHNDCHYREGRLIAERIATLVGEGVVIGCGENARRLGYGDVILLIRSRTHVHDYERALREAGIPYLGTDRGTLLESLEIRDMVALLATLITPFDNLSLATVLRSPLFACSDQDLMCLARQGKGNWRGHLETLAGIMPDSPLARACRCLSNWSAVADKLPIHDLLDRIYNEGNVLARYEAAYPEHLRSRVAANLTRFIELALEIDSGRYPSLTHFLAKLKEMRENAREAPDEAPAGSGRRVRIMTIHAAKGLEAPVVFLADATNANEKDGAYRVITDWPANAAGPQGMLLAGRREQRDPFTVRQLDRERLEEARESANLLYVALTRARQLLFVSGTAPTRSGDPGWYGLVRQALDPLGEHGGEEDITLECARMPAAAPPLERPEQPRPCPDPDPMLSQVLDVKPLIREIAPSRTVTERTSAEEADEEDALLRGVAIHKLLEHLMSRPELPLEFHARTVADAIGIPRDDVDFQNWMSEAVELVRCTPLSDIFETSHESYCEIPVQYQSGKGTIHGIIDRVVTLPEEVWVIDYKTHRQASAATVPGLALRYREQLRMYAEAAARIWPGRRVRAFILFTACRHLYEMDITNESLR